MARKPEDKWFDRVSRWVGAVAGARRGRVAHVAAASGLDGIAAREFEALLGEAFRLQGYQLAETGAPHRDVDLVLRRDRQTYLVHCKEWQAGKVGVDVAQRLHRLMVARGAAGAFIVTSGRFSREATAFANGCSIRLIEGPGLQGMLRQARAARAGAPPAVQQTS